LRDSDIVILDTGSDLNVYVDLAKDGDGKGGGTAPCCGPSATATAPAEVEAAVVDCCSTAKETAGCCSKTEDDTMPCCENSASGATASNAETGCCSAASLKTQEDMAGDFDLADIDINEWAGKDSVPYLFLPLTFNRFVQDLGVETVGLTERPTTSSKAGARGVADDIQGHRSQTNQVRRSKNMSHSDLPHRPFTLPKNAMLVQVTKS
jgi:hypothetical protein